MGTIDFMPRKDDEFRTWAESFVGGIADAPSRYMLCQADVDSLTRALNEFQAAYKLAENETTRTRPTITDKQDRRWTLQEMMRGYARAIKINEGIDDSDKIALGVPPENPARNRRQVPDVSPSLNFIEQTPGVDHLRLRDPSSNSSAKPYGAERAEVFVAYTEPGDPPPTIEDARYLRSYRKKNIEIRHDPAVGTKQATYWARWAGFNDDVGPWSLPVSMAMAKRKAQKQQAEAEAKVKAASDKDAAEPAMKIAA